MADNEIIKALKWLIFNFPKIENPKDETDKMCNCINLYCQNAIDELNRKDAEIERLQTELVANTYSENTFKEENRRLIKLKKNDAIKEFAERFKCNASILCDKVTGLPCSYTISNYNFNLLLKEMVGDDNA